MFFETSFLGAVTTGATLPVVNPTAPTLWQQLGFSSKEEWRTQGKPQPAGGSSGDGSSFTPPGGAPTIGPGGTTTGGGVPVDGGGPTTGGAPSGGGFLSGIPTTYLLIGGALVLLMVLKK